MDLISIIICSRHTQLSPTLTDNIKNTVGTDYEIVVINNSDNKYNIFQAYNEGVRRASGDILCFMHDDILFKTNNWGQIVKKEFWRNKHLGCLGVLGGHLLPKEPGYWNDGRLASGNHLQKRGNKIVKETNDKFLNHNIIEVAACDGLWMCITSKPFITNEIAFDETFTGFHMYDMDICVQLLTKGYSNMVTDQILIEHHNDPEKSFNTMFYDDLTLFYNKWTASDKDFFPILRGISTKRALSELLNLLYKTETELHRTKNSKAYKLGKLLLTPFHKIKKA